MLASPTLPTLIAIQVLVALVFYCGYYATVPSFLAELFPTRRRTTGISIAYVLAQLVFGGVTPLVVARLITATGNPRGPRALSCGGDAAEPGLPGGVLAPEGTRGRRCNPVRGAAPRLGLASVPHCLGV